MIVKWWWKRLLIRNFRPCVLHSRAALELFIFLNITYYNICFYNFKPVWVGRNRYFHEVKTYSFFACYRKAVIDYHLHWQCFLITRKSWIETLVSFNKKDMSFVCNVKHRVCICKRYNILCVYSIYYLLFVQWDSYFVSQ